MTKLKKLGFQDLGLFSQKSKEFYYVGQMCKVYVLCKKGIYTIVLYNKLDDKCLYGITLKKFNKKANMINYVAKLIELV